MIAAVAEPIVKTRTPEPSVEHAPRRATSAQQTLQIENEHLRRLLEVKQRLSELALRGENATTIAAELAAETGLEVRLLDPLLQVVTDEPSVEADTWTLPRRLVRQVLTRLLNSQTAARFSQSRPRRTRLWYTVAPVLCNEATLGYIALREDAAPETSRFDEASLLALASYAAIACSLSLGSEHVRGQIIEETAASFLRELLNEELPRTKAAANASKIGYDARTAHRVVIACPLGSAKTGDRPALTAPARRRVLDVVARVFRRLAPGAQLLIEDDHLAAVLEAESEAISLQALAEVRGLFHRIDLALGASSPVTEAPDLKRAYQEALKACQVGLTFQNLRRDAVLHFEQLGFYGLLTQVRGNGELTSFVNTVLGPLVDYDRSRKRTLLETVRSFLTNHGSLVRTCEDLRIQPSTLTYRIQRIKAIGRLDLYSINDVLLAQAAMLIWDGGVATGPSGSLGKTQRSKTSTAGRRRAMSPFYI